jgi:hypothetical protein
LALTSDERTIPSHNDWHKTCSYSSVALSPLDLQLAGLTCRRFRVDPQE